MKWKKEKPKMNRKDLIIMNFNKKSKIHKNVRLRKKGYYVFKVKNEYTIIGFVNNPSVLGNVTDWKSEEKITVKRNIKEIHDLIIEFYTNKDLLSTVDKRIVQKVLQLASVEANKMVKDKNTWYRMCCLWDKIKATEENKQE
tara:strand:- start:917 stop:1342 length:426 start_codon:yes stop_codon:yes gene_type:complete